jgi:hypothetical protein
MLTNIKLLLARTLPPETLFWVRSIKRAVMGEAPLPQHTRNTETVKPPIMQDIALEKYRAKTISAPFLFFNENEILILPAKEIARTLTLSVMYLNSAHVNGDIAEFGTMGGFTARTLAAAMVFDYLVQPITNETIRDPFRRLRLFDSFEGLPEITSEVDLASPHVVSGTWAKGGCRILSATQLREMIEGILPPSRIEITKGWFSDTVGLLPDDTRFAMIHFDGDLYQSTMDALVPCFERGFVSEGAVICFDEWSVNRAIPAYGERRAWAELVERFQIKASHCGDYAINGTKFIIHSYVGMLPDA